jgi:PAS domain S-box-containing protein
MKVPLKILHLEDDPNDALLIQSTLENGGVACTVTRVETSGHFLAVLERGGVDLIISDYSLPQYDGMSALKLVRAQWPELPFILVSGTLGEELAIESLKSGATDYVLKDRLSRLVPVVLRAMEDFARQAERRQAEAELRRKTALLEAQLNATIDAILVVDEQGRKILQNERMLKMWNIPPEIANDPNDQSQLEFVLGQVSQPESFLERVRHLYSRPQEISRDEIERKDGTVLDRYSSPVLDKQGKYYGRIWTFRDITERKLAERQLRKLSRAVEQSPGIVVITDLAGNIEYVNPKFSEVTGYSAAEVLGQNTRILKSGTSSPAHYQHLWQTILGGGEWRGEFHNQKKNGDLYWERASISPITNEHNVITHYLAVKEDITEHKQLEAQFRQAQKMESVGRLAAGVAHDFNNLLTIILGYSSLLLADPVAEGATTDGLNEIKKAGERAAGLTRQLLAFSRQQLLEPRELNVNEIVTDCAKMLRRLVGEDVGMEVVLDPGVAQVRIDPGQLEQVLLNLVVNARDAIPQFGRISIQTAGADVDESHCRAHPGAKPGRYVALIVTDTGCGMDEATQAQIFEPFFTTKGPGKGTGLGLSMVFGFIQQSGGHIVVSSRPGAGSTFTIYMPAFEGEEVPSEAEDQQKPLPGGSETILLVEDESGVRMLSRQVLVARGYTVLEAAQGHEAIELVQRGGQTIHLLITDMVMPGMGGSQLAEQVRALIPGIKLLLISGYSDDTLLRHGGVMPGTHFLQKPFSVSTLTVKVREILDQ